jgi:hypothetical protein
VFCIVYFIRGDIFPAMAFTTSFAVWIVPQGVGLMASRSAPRGPLVLSVSR